MKKFTLKQLIISALIAALYTALTLPLGSFASRSILQIRPAEALTILPLLFIEAVPGVAIGCMLSNVFSGYGLYDIVFGTLITLFAAVATRNSKHPIIGALPPIIFNAVFLPVIWKMAGSDELYFYSMISTLITQSVWVLGLGLPLYYSVKRIKPKIYKNVLESVSRNNKDN